MPELLVDVTTRVVVPVTAPPGTGAGAGAGDPCTDPFTLEALGRVFVTSQRIWAQAGPDTAEGLARAVIDFAEQFLTEDHEDAAPTSSVSWRRPEWARPSMRIAPAGGQPERRSTV
ncbi:hypothetical protein ACFU99_11925 [Streptomyces sp. NPDC057654]|uniref:hypothetical protein n=1 Tax=Streptomyces sp. NPDC057654 TaxID=3346196 RepID=UPI0036C8D531